MWPFTRRGRDAPAANVETAQGLKSLMVNLWGLVWRPRGDRNLCGSEAVFAAVTRLANTLAATPFHLYGSDRKIAVNHPLEMLIGRAPAPGITQHLYLQTMETCRDTNGNAYALKVPSVSGGIVALDVLEPSTVTPLRDEASGDVWYRLHPADGSELYVHSREIIHVRHVSAGGLLGVSPIAVLADTLDYDNQMKTFSVQQAKGINSAVVLEFPTNLGKPQQQLVIDDFTQNYRASSGGLLVVSGGTKASVINKSPVDSKALDVARITSNRVASVYNLPPHLLGDYSSGASGGYSSQEQSMLEFLSMTMSSIYKAYEDEHNLKLLTQADIAKGYYFHFDRDALLMADMATRTTRNQTAIRSGYMTINEVRQSEGLPAHADGDVLLGSKDLAPMKWISTRDMTKQQ